MKGTRRKFTSEFREEAVRLVLQERMSVLDAAKRLEISDKSLANWVRAARQGKDATSGCWRGSSKGAFGERA